MTTAKKGKVLKKAKAIKKVKVRASPRAGRETPVEVFNSAMNRDSEQTETIRSEALNKGDFGDRNVIIDKISYF